MTTIDLSLSGSILICNKIVGFFLFAYPMQLNLICSALICPGQKNSFFENLVFAYLIKKFPAIYATRRFLCTCPHPHLPFNYSKFQIICFPPFLKNHSFFVVPYLERLTLRLLMSYIYMEHLFLMFLDHTQRRSTFGRTPLDE